MGLQFSVQCCFDQRNTAAELNYILMLSYAIIANDKKVSKIIKRRFYNLAPTVLQF